MRETYRGSDALGIYADPDSYWDQLIRAQTLGTNPEDPNQLTHPVFSVTDAVRDDASQTLPVFVLQADN